jgi:hypothetical protein
MSGDYPFRPRTLLQDARAASSGSSWAAAVRAWYDHGDEDGPLPALREVLTGLLPDARIRSWHTRRCADAYTAHRHPYIDILEPGRLIIALGGNGRGAQAADAVGYLIAHLALTGQWQSGLPRDASATSPPTAPGTA